MNPAFRALLRDDLTSFTHQVFNTVSPSSIFAPNWHVNLISEYLLACQKGEIKRLIINIPPRFMKSISVSVAFPAWLLAHDPKTQIMCASYGMALSHKHSLDCRLVLEQEWFKEVYPQVKLVDDQNTKSKFMTTERGFRMSTSIGSAVTGAGADFLIVDDPLNADNANSEVAIENANNWFDQVYSTRLNDPKKGCMIVIMQRLHEKDLSGHLLKKGGWEHLRLPLISEKDEVISKGNIRIERKEGDLLHPERIGESEVIQLKNILGPYGFAGQYQQSPSPAGGGVFKQEWIQYYNTVEPSKLNVYMFIDPANSKGKNSDYTAIAVLGVGADKNIYVIDMVRDRLDVKGREDIIFSLHQKYKPLGVYIEKYGMQVDIDWLRYSMDRLNYRFPVYEVGGAMDKVSRIKRLEAMFARGQIWFPRHMHKACSDNTVVDLVEEFITKEYVTFPRGLHDDMLDAMSRICDITIEYPGNNNFDYYSFAKGFQ